MSEKIAAIQDYIRVLNERAEDLDTPEAELESIAMQLKAAEADLLHEKAAVAQAEVFPTAPEPNPPPYGVIGEVMAQEEYTGVLKEEDLTALEKFLARKKSGKEATSIEYQLIITHGEDMGLSRAACERCAETYRLNENFSWISLEQLKDKLEETAVIFQEVAERIGIAQKWEPQKEEDFDRIVNWQLYLKEWEERAKAQLAKIQNIIKHDNDWIERNYHGALRDFVLKNAKSGTKTYHFASGSVTLMNQAGGIVLNPESWADKEREKFYADLPVAVRDSLKVTTSTETRYKHNDLKLVYGYLGQLKELPKGFIKREPVDNKISVRSPKQ